MTAVDWREKSYGRLKGGEIETLLHAFGDCWSGREDLFDISSEEGLRDAVQRLASTPNWAPLYLISLPQLITRLLVVTGTASAVVEAVKQGRAVAGAFEVFEGLPDLPPEDPDAVPIAFAMLGNLDAIARFSRSINDMIKAAQEGDPEALFNAMSVDSIVSTLSGVQAMLRLGQLGGDSDFAEAVASAIKGPHKKRLIYPELRWAEYLLRDQGAFQACSREEIYDLIVVHLCLYDPTGVKKDPKAALFTLFRAWQKEAGIQNPRFGFSGKRK